MRLVVAALALTAVVNGFQIVRASRDVVYHFGEGTSIPAECVVGSHDGLRVLDPECLTNAPNFAGEFPTGNGSGQSSTGVITNPGPVERFFVAEHRDRRIRVGAHLEGTIRGVGIVLVLLSMVLAASFLAADFGTSLSTQLTFEPRRIRLYVTKCVAAALATATLAIVVLLSFFPIMKSTMLGVRSIGEDQRALFTVIRASRWKRICSLEIPAVLPYLLTGIETASVLAVTGAIVGEYLGGNEGLGALVVQTLQSLQVEQMFATIIALATFGFLFYGAISAVRRMLVPWHESEIGRAHV